MKNLIGISILIGTCAFFLEVSGSKNTAQSTNTINTYIDVRDNTSYEIIKVGKLVWFNENLSFKTEHSELVETNSGKNQGRLYAFADSKTACPQGWRLPTVREFDTLVSKTFNIDFYGHAKLNSDWTSINDNPIGFTFNHTGMLHKKKVLSRESFNIWLEDFNIDNAYHVHLYDVDKKDNSDDLTVFRHTHRIHKPKKNRKFGIRCVCETSGLE